jgi:hypothetical protein
METKVYDISIKGNVVKTEGYKLFEQQVKVLESDEEAKAYASDYARQKELEGYKRFAGNVKVGENDLNSYVSDFTNASISRKKEKVKRNKKLRKLSRSLEVSHNSSKSLLKNKKKSSKRQNLEKQLF